jgi:hypothetical protein
MSKQSKAAKAATAKASDAIELQSGDTARRSWRDSKRVHPVSAVFPRMQPDRLQELAHNIEERGGLLYPVLTCARQEDGQLYVYDGANRLDACELLGWQLVDAKDKWFGKILSFIEYRGTKTDGEVSGEVNSLNLQRRDLSESQRAMFAAKMANITHGGDRQAVSLPLDAVTQAQAAERHDVSESLVRRAKRVQREASEEDVKAIESGETTVGAVARKLKKPKSIDKINLELQGKKEPRKSAAELARIAKWQAAHPLEYAWDVSSEKKRTKFLRDHCSKWRPDGEA